MITEAAPPKNRRLLCAMAQHQAPFGQLADAAFGLSYCFARTYFVAGGAKARRGKRLTVEILERAAKPYSITADYYGYVQSPGFWARHENEDITWKWAIRAIRWSYNDQVARWQKGLGVKMGEGIGFGELENGLVQGFPDVLFEHGGRFFEAEN